jgi:hypothetical protein
MARSRSGPLTAAPPSRNCIGQSLGLGRSRPRLFLQSNSGWRKTLDLCFCRIAEMDCGPGGCDSRERDSDRRRSGTQCRKAPARHEKHPESGASVPLPWRVQTAAADCDCWPHYCPPPVGLDASHAETSSGRYRTAAPILMYFGPWRRSRQRRTDATDKPVRRATSCSVKSSQRLFAVAIYTPFGGRVASQCEHRLGSDEK